MATSSLTAQLSSHLHLAPRVDLLRKHTPPLWVSHLLALPRSGCRPGLLAPPCPWLSERNACRARCAHAGPEDESIPSQLLSVAPASRCLQALLTRVNATLPSEAGDAEVVFLAELPPTGYNVYFLRVRGLCARCSGYMRASLHRPVQPSAGGHSRLLGGRGLCDAVASECRINLLDR